MLTILPHCRHIYFLKKNGPVAKHQMVKEIYLMDNKKDATASKNRF